MNNRVVLGICGLAFLALFATGVPRLLHPTSSLSQTPISMTSVTVVTITGTNAGSGAANQYVAITGLEVNYSGIIYSGFVNPSCATDRHACLLPEAAFFYLVSNSSAYRLISMSVPFMFADGTRVIVTGILVPPTSFNATPLEGYAFAGDIYVQSIRAA